MSDDTKITPKRRLRNVVNEADLIALGSCYNSYFIERMTYVDNGLSKCMSRSIIPV